MKKLFTNYNFAFSKNEKKLLVTFCKQALKQVENDNRYFHEERALHAIIEKLSSDTEEVKLTKDEKVRLKFQLEQNVKFMKQTMAKSWFLKKWLYKSMLVQYEGILENHFKQ